MVECDACKKIVAFSELTPVGIVFLYCKECMTRTGRNSMDDSEEEFEEEEDEE